MSAWWAGYVLGTLALVQAFLLLAIVGALGKLDAHGKRLAALAEGIAAAADKTATNTLATFATVRGTAAPGANPGDAVLRDAARRKAPGSAP